MAPAAALLLVLAVGVVSCVDRHLFRANDTLLGAPVKCTDAEKACFRYNRLLDAATGKCYRVGSRGPCLDKAFLLDREAFESGRQLVGVCGDPGRCSDHRFRMAYDGECYTGNEVFGTFCDVRHGTSGWPYFFGGYECVCEGAGCPPSRYVHQPPAPGMCLFPNFRKDITSRFFPRLPKGDLECSLEQSACFSMGMLSYGSDDQCFPLLDQGPCPDGHHLVIDKLLALRHKRLGTRCVPVDRCATGFSYLSYHQRCVNKTMIENVMCADLNTFIDVFGETVCRFKEEYYEVVLKTPREGMCSIRYNVQLTGVEELPKPKCTSFDPLECLSFEEEIDPDALMRSFEEN